jgi:hypothetical protein
LLFNFIKEVSPELRKEIGFKINNLKNIAESIFETNKLSEKWDGKMNGGDYVHENAYVYYITVKNGVGVLYERRGTITVLKN